MAPRKKKAGMAKGGAVGDVPPPGGGDGQDEELRSMFRNFMMTQQAQEDRYERDMARQEQRWRVLQHQFSLLQGEVTRDRRERGAAAKGLSVSAQVSTLTSPLARQGVLDCFKGSSSSRGSSGCGSGGGTKDRSTSSSAGNNSSGDSGSGSSHDNSGGSINNHRAPTASAPGGGPVPGGLTVPWTQWGAGMHTSVSFLPMGHFQNDMASPPVLSPVAVDYSHFPHYAGWRGPRLQRYVEGEDIEHFLTAFEQIASASGCPRAEWAMHLVPLLTGKAKAAYIAMDFDETMDYDKVRMAILDKFEINPETYRQRFRSLEVQLDETPKELYTRLKELYEKWVCPKARSKEEIGELLVLEQFLRMVNSEVRLWIKKHDPSSAKEAVSLADAFMSAQKGSRQYKLSSSRPYEAPKSGRPEGGQVSSERRSEHPPKAPNEEPVCYHCGQTGHIKPKCPLRKPEVSHVCYIPDGEVTDCLGEQWESMVEVTIDGKQLKALIDTGSSQTLVGVKWVPEDGVQTEHTMKIRCVHGDVISYPTADIYMQIGEQEYLVSVGVAEHLPYPVVLGKDIPGLLELVKPVKPCNMVVTRAKIRERGTDCSWDVLPFPEHPPKVPKTRSQRRREQFRGTRVQETLPLLESGEHTSVALSHNIRELQKADDTLESCFKDFNPDSEGNAEATKFRLKQGILYCHGDGGEQLVVPKSLQSTVLELGHSGAPATFHRLMDRVLEGAREYASAYLDDVVVFSRTWKDHLTHVRDVLQRIKTAGLTVNPNKCAMAQWGARTAKAGGVPQPKTLPTELRYSTVEKECLAIKWALESLKYYLVGKDFILETDHRALKWLHRMKDTNSRVTRWYISLQPFNF
ncbi:hypothetical protein AALO_G00218190 [Alosa alosa]|uniref:Reverse transcriptase n=1 Tax=Alosa alosa TaxID=278164 RepID=A0AAV6FW98_9TELE|nr:hypothetical protein AALO_G00218190 [Alosa alosa]